MKSTGGTGVMQALGAAATAVGLALVLAGFLMPMQPAAAQDGDAPADEPAPEVEFRIEARFQAEGADDGPPYVLAVRGATELPAGVRIRVTVRLGDEADAVTLARTVRVTDGGFRTTFDEGWETLPPGAYHVEAVYRRASQSSTVRRRLGDLPDVLRARTLLEVDPEEADAALLQTLEFYTGRMREYRALLAELREQVDDMERGRRAGQWNRWLDGDWRPRVATVRRTLEQHEEARPVLRFPRAHHGIVGMHDALILLSRRYSRDLHAGWGRNHPPGDDLMQGEDDHPPAHHLKSLAAAGEAVLGHLRLGRGADYWSMRLDLVDTLQQEIRQAASEAREKEDRTIFEKARVKWAEKVQREARIVELVAGSLPVTPDYVVEADAEERLVEIFTVLAELENAAGKHLAEQMDERPTGDDRRARDRGAVLKDLTTKARALADDLDLFGAGPDIWQEPSGEGDTPDDRVPDR